MDVDPSAPCSEGLDVPLAGTVYGTLLNGRQQFALTREFREPPYKANRPAWLANKLFLHGVVLEPG